MKLECSSCHSRYTIDSAIVPPQGAKIRCRKCGSVIDVPPLGIDTPVEYVAPTAPAAPPTPAFAPPTPAFAPPTPAFAPSTYPATSTVASAPASPATSGSPGGSSSPVPEGLSPEEKSKHDKARRLARVLASDIAVYNREKKDRGLADGNLVAVLGYEIKKSWEIYKERVGADFANGTPYFRDALNDLLAEGKKIF